MTGFRAFAGDSQIVTSLLIGNYGEMKQLPEQESHCLESIDQSLIQKVVQTYKGHKASGHGEMAARNAAIMVLRENLPSWTFRAASEMVSRIIAFSGHTGQTA